MRDFTRPAGRLRVLPLAARLAYSVFAVFTVAALGLTAWLADEMVGSRLQRVGEYYAGTAPTAAEQHQRAGDVNPMGPEIDLPAEADAPRAPSVMPRRKLLEITHFHLFSMPVYLLILSHLFMLATVRPRMKYIVIGGASLATVAHIAAPWVAAAGADHASATVFYGASGALLAASYLVMTVWPLWEMWAPVSRSGRGDLEVENGK